MHKFIYVPCTYFICSFVSYKRWYDTLRLLRWNGSCSAFPLQLTGVHPSGADRGCAPRTPWLCCPSPAHPSWAAALAPRQVLPHWLHSRTSLQLPVPCARCCCLQLCPDWRNLERMPTRLLFSPGASSAAALLDSQRHTQNCCSSHLDFSSFSSRCIWFFSWSLSLLVPVSGTKMKYFSLLDYFKQNMLPLVLISSARCDLPYGCNETK